MDISFAIPASLASTCFLYSSAYVYDTSSCLPHVHDYFFHITMSSRNLLGNKALTPEQAPTPQPNSRPVVHELLDTQDLVDASRLTINTGQRSTTARKRSADTNKVFWDAPAVPEDLDMKTILTSICLIRMSANPSVNPQFDALINAIQLTTDLD